MLQSNIIWCEHELLQNENLPTLILTLEGEILHLNEAAIELFNNHYHEGQYLEMDEPSYNKWLNVLENVSLYKSPIVLDFNVVIQYGVFHNLKMEIGNKGSSQFVRVRVLSAEETNLKQSYEINKTSVNSKLSYGHLMQYVSKGIVITNHHGTIVDINKCALILLNRKRYELIYEPHAILFESLEEQGTSLQQYVYNIRKNGHASCVMAYKTKKEKNIYLKFESIQDQSEKYIITTISDVTKKIVMQSQLEQNDSLNMIGQMAASIAHEIRNPMTSLLGFTALLKENATEEATSYLSVIESELHRIENILGEMLELSKPRQRKMDKVDIALLLQDVIAIMLPHAAMYNCTLQLINTVHHPLFINGCQISFKQVFINLLKNALESMQNGGNVKLELHLNVDMVEINVVDEGVGMSSDCMEKMFQAFQTTKQNGTGLGLPYVKSIIEECNGEICVQSEVGKGTTFTLQFPKANCKEILKFVY